MGIVLIFFQNGEFIQKTEQHHKVLLHNFLAHLLYLRDPQNPMVF